MRVVGIDPGASGAIALFDTDFGSLQIVDTPTAIVKSGRSERTRIVPSLFAQALENLRAEHAFIELVGAMPKQGLSSTFTFGHTAGVAEGILAALRIPYARLLPQEWQKLARVSGGKDGARMRAAQLFPAYATKFARVKDDGRADASCIAFAGSLILTKGAAL